MPSRWLTFKALPLSLNNYASIYIYLSLVCNKRKRRFGNRVDAMFGQSLLRKKAHPRFAYSSRE
jgi:hypothetical protein